MEETVETILVREQKANAYLSAWKKVFGWKKLSTAEISQPVQKKVKVLSLLEKNDLTQEDFYELEILQSIAEITAKFLGETIVAKFTPDIVHIILYPKHLDSDLFPNHGERAGFHLRRGGYPVMLIPMSQENDGDYMLQPFIIGHELGEIADATLLRDPAGKIGPLAHSARHPLKEGFCDMAGLVFCEFFSRSQGKVFPYTYDQVMMENYKRQDCKKLLGDLPFADASTEERSFMKYRLAGSIVSRLVEKYSWPKVLEYFAKEAHAKIKIDGEIKHSLDSLSVISDGLFKVNFKSERTTVPSDDPKLHDLLALIGYDPHDFGLLDSSTKPFDDKPEGAVAALIVDQYSSLFVEKPADLISHDESITQSVEQQRSSTLIIKPSFTDTVKLGINEQIAKNVFGQDFLVETFIGNWRQEFLQKLT